MGLRRIGGGTEGMQPSANLSPLIRSAWRQVSSSSEDPLTVKANDSERGEGKQVGRSFADPQAVINGIGRSESSTLKWVERLL